MESSDEQLQNQKNSLGELVIRGRIEPSKPQDCVVQCQSQYLIVALVPWLPRPFPVGWFINSLCDYVMIERSTDGGMI